jgi:hypothetical protein
VKAVAHGPHALLGTRIDAVERLGVVAQCSLGGSRPELELREPGKDAQRSARLGRRRRQRQHVVGDQAVAAPAQRGGSGGLAHAFLADEGHRPAVDGHGAGVKREEAALAKRNAQRHAHDHRAHGAFVHLRQRVEDDLRPASHAHGSDEVPEDERLVPVDPHETALLVERLGGRSRSQVAAPHDEVGRSAAVAPEEFGQRHVGVDLQAEGSVGVHRCG